MSLRGILRFLHQRFAGLLTVAVLCAAPFASLLYVGVFVYLGYAFHPLLYVGCLGVFAVRWVVRMMLRPGRHRRVLARIHDQWLSPSDPEVDFGWLDEQYFSWTWRDEFGIDDFSWEELELDAVFGKLNRTFSSLGEISLYSTLRTPSCDKTCIRKRMQLVALLQNERPLRENLQVTLNALGKDRRFQLDHMDRATEGIPHWLRRMGQFLASALAICIVILVLHPASLAAALAVGLTLFNLVFAVWFRYFFFWKAGTFIFLGKAIACAADLAELDDEPLRPYTERLRNLSKLMQEIRAKSNMFILHEDTSADPFVLLLQYMRSFFLVDITDYYRFDALVRKHSASIKEMLILLGDLDAAQSIVSFRQRLAAYCEPGFCDDETPTVECEACRHPLIDAAIPNSISLSGKSAFITGANTSGKSTFLRTVAANAIMAQTIGTVSAASYRASLFRVRSSMNVFDDISRSKSLYQMEAERMRDIILAADGSEPVLCVLDEPLKGTNSPEAICATIEILDYLSRKKALVLVSSHHVQIANELPPEYQVFHFVEPTTENRSDKNFRLQPGRNYTFNGIETLEKVGFPPRIVRGAKERMMGWSGVKM